MTAPIDKKLHAYIEQLNPAQKKSLLGFIKTILPPKEEVYTIEDYNKELDEAEAAIDRGEFHTNEEVFATINKVISGRK